MKASQRQVKENPFELLSRCENDVVDLILIGKDEKQIADAMSLSKHTVKTYKRSVFDKLQIHGRSSLFDLSNEFDRRNSLTDTLICPLCKGRNKPKSSYCRDCGTYLKLVESDE